MGPGESILCFSIPQDWKTTKKNYPDLTRKLELSMKVAKDREEELRQAKILCEKANQLFQQTINEYEELRLKLFKEAVRKQGITPCGICHNYVSTASLEAMYIEKIHVISNDAATVEETRTFKFLRDICGKCYKDGILNSGMNPKGFVKSFMAYAVQLSEGLYTIFLYTDGKASTKGISLPKDAVIEEPFYPMDEILARRFNIPAPLYQETNDYSF